MNISFGAVILNLDHVKTVRIESLTDGARLIVLLTESETPIIYLFESSAAAAKVFDAIHLYMKAVPYLEEDQGKPYNVTEFLRNYNDNKPEPKRKNENESLRLALVIFYLVLGALIFSVVLKVSYCVNAETNAVIDAR